jgi:enolase-phosphatase E1
VIVSAAAIVTDIEGTTTPIAFVHELLFPYARARLPAYVAANPNDPDVLEAARLAADGDALAALLGWMDADAKVAPLKSLQGRLWHEGYRTGALQAVLYPDVAPALRRWYAAGKRLCVYSSGSVEAQKLLFGHTAEGDLCPLFSAYFDTRTGPKREPASYTSIAGAIGVAPSACLFLSDVEAELDAASKAGMQTCQLVRPEDGTIPSKRHPGHADFSAITVQLP